MPIFRQKRPGFAWETVTEDEGGGGFAIGSSYLALEGTPIAGTAMGASTHLLWAELASAGSDISLRAGGEFIDFATDGWYSLAVWAPLAGAANQIQLTYLAPGGPGQRSLDLYLSADPALGSYDLTVSNPAGPMVAGDAISFQAYADNAGSTGTYDVGPQDPWALITRLA